MNILDYAHAYDGYGHIETEISYWSVVSFDARLNWATNVTAHKLRHDTHTLLLERWTKLSERTRKKAKKRAEVAHGSVVRVSGEPSAYFIPYYHRRWTDFRSLEPNIDDTFPEEFPQFAKHLNEASFEERTRSFDRLQSDMFGFLHDWIERDIETGLLQPPPDTPNGEPPLPRENLNQ